MEVKCSSEMSVDSTEEKILQVILIGGYRQQTVYNEKKTRIPLRVRLRHLIRKVKNVIKKPALLGGQLSKWSINTALFTMKNLNFKLISEILSLSLTASVV
jgi:hypothetical protein